MELNADNIREILMRHTAELGEYFNHDGEGNYSDERVMDDEDIELIINSLLKLTPIKFK